MALDKEIKKKMCDEFGLHSGDTGSAEAQVAMLTENIRQLTEHLKTHHKDFSSKRGLLKQVAQRKCFLKYLAKRSPEKYKLLIEKLGLKG